MPSSNLHLSPLSAGTHRPRGFPSSELTPRACATMAPKAAPPSPAAIECDPPSDSSSFPDTKADTVVVRSEAGAPGSRSRSRSHLPVPVEIAPATAGGEPPAAAPLVQAVGWGEENDNLFAASWLDRAEQDEQEQSRVRAHSRRTSEPSPRRARGAASSSSRGPGPAAPASGSGHHAPWGLPLVSGASAPSESVGAGFARYFQRQAAADGALASRPHQCPSMSSRRHRWRLAACPFGGE